jgi:hypothetical protein
MAKTVADAAVETFTVRSDNHHLGMGSCNHVACGSHFRRMDRLTSMIIMVAKRW